MRTTVILKGFGSTLNEIVKSLETSWKEFVEDENADLPRDSEVHIMRSEDSEIFDATCTIRTKVEK